MKTAFAFIVDKIAADLKSGKCRGKADENPKNQSAKRPEQKAA